jgi:uncharacterized protein with von Willebrand factor type A (vWA) domain
MARGWDSKAVEEQIEQAHHETIGTKEPPTGEDAARKRQRQGIELARKRVLHQLEGAENPAYQKLLRETLVELDKKLAKLK